jgi:hypothetical protein
MGTAAAESSSAHTSSVQVPETRNYISARDLQSTDHHEHAGRDDDDDNDDGTRFNLKYVPGLYRLMQTEHL